MKTSEKVLIVGADSTLRNVVYRTVNTCNVYINKSPSLSKTISVLKQHEYMLCLIIDDDGTFIQRNALKELEEITKQHEVPILWMGPEAPEQTSLLSMIENAYIDFLCLPVNVAVLKGKVASYQYRYRQRKLLEEEIALRIEGEERLRKLQISQETVRQKAEESDKLKSAFLSNMSHEIRTPMNAIIGFSNLLSNEQLDEEQKLQYTKYINNSSNALLRLIDDIIDIAKIEAGELKITTTDVFLSPLFRELYKVYSGVLTRRAKSHIKLVLDITDSNIQLTTDEVRLRQIISNLLGNAIKFTENGEIIFGFTIHNNMVDMFVRDTGIGIPQSKLNTVFKRFERVDNHSIPNANGTGLGLSIACELATLLGGELHVQSQERVGTCFNLLLPYNGDRAVLQACNINDTAENRLSKSNKWNDKLVLIAEDEFINFQFIKESLRETGIKILWAKDGIKAIDMVNKNPQIDVILMDIKMPRLSGYEATVTIKSAYPGIPVIAQTAYAMAGEKEKCMQAGFDDYITKPIKVRELIDKIEMFLSHKIIA